ncbi:TPA: hypothetical protein ACH3X1_009445 [Trebouxia sp. C0004]
MGVFDDEQHGQLKMFPLVIQDCVHAYEEFLSAPGMAIEPCIASGGVEVEGVDDSPSE